mgnify:CR=1 FL=1
MLQQIPSDAPGPLDLLEQASNAHALQQCMKALQTPQRACLALADSALYAAKAQGRDRFFSYEIRMDTDTHRRSLGSGVDHTPLR